MDGKKLRKADEDLRSHTSTVAYKRTQLDLKNILGMQ